MAVTFGAVVDTASTCLPVAHADFVVEFRIFAFLCIHFN